MNIFQRKRNKVLNTEELLLRKKKGLKRKVTGKFGLETPILYNGDLKGHRATQCL